MSIREEDYQTKYRNICEEKITRTVNINGKLKVNGSVDSKMGVVPTYRRVPKSSS